MKAHLQRILAMTKAGTIDDEQAAQLIEALHEPPPRAARSRTSTGFLGGVVEAVRSAIDSVPTSTTSGLLASELEANELSMSHVRLDRAEGHAFRDNVVSMSSVERLKLIDSEFVGNELSSSQFDDAALEAAVVRGCTISSSSLTGLRLDRSQLEGLRVSSSSLSGWNLSSESGLTGCEVRSSTVKKLAMSGSTLASVIVTGASVTGLTLERSEVEHGQISGSNVGKLRLTRSRWLTTFLRELVLDDVQLEDTTFNDVLLAGGEGWRKRGLTRVRLEGCRFDKTVFANCQLRDVTLKNVELSGERLDGIELSDRLFDGTAAFREALRARGS